MANCGEGFPLLFYKICSYLYQVTNFRIFVFLFEDLPSHWTSSNFRLVFMNLFFIRYFFPGCFFPNSLDWQAFDFNGQVFLKVPSRNNYWWLMWPWMMFKALLLLWCSAAPVLQPLENLKTFSRCVFHNQSTSFPPLFKFPNCGSSHAIAIEVQPQIIDERSQPPKSCIFDVKGS